MNNLFVTDAGRGWWRVWNGNDLLAACPSRRAADEVIRAFCAHEQLCVARTKIALLEKTLDQQLSKRIYLNLSTHRG